MVPELQLCILNNVAVVQQDTFWGEAVDGCKECDRWNFIPPDKVLRGVTEVWISRRWSGTCHNCSCSCLSERHFLALKKTKTNFHWMSSYCREREISPRKNSGAQLGIEPKTSWMLVRRSYHWATGARGRGAEDNYIIYRSQPNPADSLSLGGDPLRTG